MQNDSGGQSYYIHDVFCPAYQLHIALPNNPWKCCWRHSIGHTLNIAVVYMMFDLFLSRINVAKFLTVQVNAFIKTLELDWYPLYCQPLQQYTYTMYSTEACWGYPKMD